MPKKAVAVVAVRVPAKTKLKIIKEVVQKWATSFHLLICDSTKKSHLATEGTEFLIFLSCFLCVLITLWAVTELVFAMDSLVISMGLIAQNTRQMSRDILQHLRPFL